MYVLAQNIISTISIDQEPIHPIHFQSLLIFLMAYSKAKLKRNGYKLSPWFRPF